MKYFDNSDPKLFMKQIKTVAKYVMFTAQQPEETAYQIADGTVSEAIKKEINEKTKCAEMKTILLMFGNVLDHNYSILLLTKPR